MKIKIGYDVAFELPPSLPCCDVVIEEFFRPLQIRLNVCVRDTTSTAWE